MCSWRIHDVSVDEGLRRLVRRGPSGDVGGPSNCIPRRFVSKLVAADATVAGDPEEFGLAGEVLDGAADVGGQRNEGVMLRADGCQC